MKIWLGPNSEVAQEVATGPRYPGADRVLRAVYVWLAMEWATRTVMASWYTQARQEDAARERARKLGAELAKAARALVDEIDFEVSACAGEILRLRQMMRRRELRLRWRAALRGSRDAADRLEFRVRYLGNSGPDGTPSWQLFAREARRLRVAGPRGVLP